MTRPLLSLALRELLRGECVDHRRVATAFDGGEASPRLAPVDPELAELAEQLRCLRAADPEASTLLLLSEAAVTVPTAVERHVAWLSEPAQAPAVVVLDGWQIPSSAAELLQLTA